MRKFYLNCHSFAYYRLWLFKFFWCRFHSCPRCIFGHVVHGNDMGVSFSYIECPFAWDNENPLYFNKTDLK